MTEIAQDLATIRDALKVIADWIPSPQNGAGSVEYDRAVRYARRKHQEAVIALASLERVPRLEAALRYMADYQMTGTEMTLHIDFQGKAREALGV